MRTRILRSVGIAFSALALGSCSYTYTVLAVVIGGKLAFIVAPSSDREPECISAIHISADKGEPAIAKAASDDDEQLVANGVFWWKSMKECENPFPVFYGQRLKGERLVYGKGVPGAGEASSVVEAKPLRAGVVYEVSTTSGSGGYGSGWFRIRRDRRVENWPHDPTPAVRNADGYDVSGPYTPPPSPAG